MKSRSERVGNRNKVKENVDLMRRAARTTKVRKWEQRWVSVEGTTMQSFRWMPVSDEKPALVSAIGSKEGVNIACVKHTRGGKKGNTAHTKPSPARPTYALDLTKKSATKGDAQQRPSPSSGYMTQRSDSRSSSSMDSIVSADVHNEDSNFSVPDSCQTYPRHYGDISPPSNSMGPGSPEADRDITNGNAEQTEPLNFTIVKRHGTNSQR